MHYFNPRLHKFLFRVLSSTGEIFHANRLTSICHNALLSSFATAINPFLSIFFGNICQLFFVGSQLIKTDFQLFLTNNQKKKDLVKAKSFFWIMIA